MSQDKEVEQKCLLNSLFNSEVFKIKRHVKYINCHHFSIFFIFFSSEEKYKLQALGKSFKNFKNHLRKISQ